MQYIRSTGGDGDGGGGGGGRRLKPRHHQGFGQGHGYQAFRCPRCDSLNTKFCYYNNYNLSQPRHFCKACRRYWTKGGLLRNVPVGGASRKTNKKPNNPHPSSVAVAPTCERISLDSNNSSSDSSSPTANTSAATATTTPITLTEALSGSNSTSSAAPTLFDFQESSTKFHNFPRLSTPNQTFEPPMLDQCSTDNNHMFSEIGTFRSLITSSSDQLPLGFNPTPEISSFLHQQDQEQVVENQNPNGQQWMQPTGESKIQEMGSAGFMDETADSRRSNGGLAVEDWEDGALFDVTGSVDQSYWSQIQWNNHEHQLNNLYSMY